MIRKHKYWITFILGLIISYALMYVFYLLMSVGLPHKTVFLQMRRYIPNAVAIGVILMLWNMSGLRWRKLWPHVLVSVAWAIVYPLSYWLTFHQNMTFIDNHFDISFAAYIFVFTAAFRLLLNIWASTPKKQKVTMVILSIIHTLLITFPLLQIIYYFNYKSPITEAACMALLQTNEAEAREFIMQNIGYGGIIGIGILFMILFACFIIGNYMKQPETSNLSKKAAICTCILFLASGIYSGTIFKETGAMDVLHNAQDYFDNAQKFNTYHADNFSSLTVTPSQPQFAKPSTIIMVIGESATSDYMSAYHQTEHDTTPWMRTMSSEPNFILFRHAYTSWAQTVPALERALTEKNQYNTLDFNQCITMLDIAKKAGYNTYWFSNQGTISNADTPITLVAKTADHSAWIEDKLANSDYMRYDGDLIPYLKQVDPKKNNFVILHIMGSHDSYDNRYPQKFAKWPSAGDHDALNEYDNSLAYTDWFLQQVYSYGKDNLNLQAMLYFSDHGVDPRIKRNPDEATFVALRIPMFLYLSDEYRQLYRQTASILRTHENTYFTNDLIYELMCGIFNIQSNHYNETYSLASKNYQFGQETLTTLLGKKSLSEDTDK